MTLESRPRAARAVSEPSFRWRLLHLFGLSNLAVAQPLFDLLGRNAEFFVAHQSGVLELSLFTLAVTLGVPLAAGIPILLAGKVSRWLGSAVYLLVVALLAGMLVLVLGRGRVPVPAAVLLTGAVLLGAATALGAASSARLRSFLSVVSALAVAVPVAFLALSPARGLLRGSTAMEVLDAAPEIASDTPVIMLVFDELPLPSLLDAAGKIHSDRFPSFARLTAEATWFRQASSVSHSTTEAVPALLTGRYPTEKRLPTARDHPENLFTLLGRDYELNVVESMTALCPEELCAGRSRETLPHGVRAQKLRALLGDAAIVYLHLLLPRELAAGLPPVTGAWRDFAPGAPARQRPSGNASESLPGGEASLDEIAAAVRYSDVPATVTAFLDALRSSAGRTRATLHYLHLQLPHTPWRYFPSGREYGPIASNLAPGVRPDTTWVENDWLIAQALQRHLLQLGYADRVLGEILATLEELGLLERSLIVVLADHGLSFLPGEPGRRPTERNASDVMVVPLLVRLPGQAQGRISERNVETIDLLPTLAEVLGIELPWPVDGQTLLDPALPERRGKRFYRSAGDFLALGGSTWESSRATAARVAELVGTGPLDSLYRIGPHPELLGRSPSSLPIGPESPHQVALEQPWLFDRVDLEGTFLPYVDGRLRGPGATASVDLAIALNGNIVATTESFAEGDSRRFTALLPEEAFAAGRNVVETFTVLAGQGGPRLARAIDRSALRYALQRSADGRVTGIEASNGTSCRLEPGAVLGEVQRTGPAFVGWASDGAGRQPFVVLMVFLGDRLVYSGSTGAEPPAEVLARAPAGAQPHLARAGFRFRLPPSLLRDEHEHAAPRLFGVVGERCAELAAADQFYWSD